MESILRAHAEQQFAAELYELEQADHRPRPANWRLSPWAVATYILGGTLDNGFAIAPKYIGNGRLIEIAIATLTTDRALLLMGVPGTGKTWVSEHLAAAISGDSTLLVQGTAGTSEEAIRYGWNYASLIAKGPTAEALVPSPSCRHARRPHGPRRGAHPHPRRRAGRPDHHPVRKAAAHPRTGPGGPGGQGVQRHRHGQRPRSGRQRPVSSALKRRFNTVVLPLPATADEEVTIVQQRVHEPGPGAGTARRTARWPKIRRVVTIFRELRQGMTEDGKAKLKSPSSTLSTAEAISVINSGLALAAHFGDGVLRATDMAASLTGAIVKDPIHDTVIWREYLETIVRERDEWGDLYQACRALI
jgi:hypothetical protein